MTQRLKPADIPTLYRFKLDKILGRGGAGTVYLGIDTDTGAPVAVKLFHANFFRNKLHEKDFARCVSKFRKFNHQNVTKINEFITGKEGACMIQEYVDGPDLKWYIENRPWNLQERLVVAAQICNGLQYLHEQGFMHHDLKPSNILFTRRGVAKLADYSLSGTSLLAMFDPGVHDQVTPMYVAPELIRKEKATPKSDMYSLGVTFYNLFTGRLPFEVDNLQKLYMCHLRVTPNPPSMVNPKCPLDLDEIIVRLMDKNPENRFRDCDELRITLSTVGRSKI